MEGLAQQSLSDAARRILPRQHQPATTIRPCPASAAADTSRHQQRTFGISSRNDVFKFLRELQCVWRSCTRAGRRAAQGASRSACAHIPLRRTQRACLLLLLLLLCCCCAVWQQLVSQHVTHLSLCLYLHTCSTCWSRFDLRVCPACPWICSLKQAHCASR